MKPSLDQSKTYKRFIEERDLALERISQRYSASQSIVMDHLIELTMDIVTAMHGRIPNIAYKPHREYEKIETIFLMASTASIDLFKRMRRSTYLLAYTGEAEAIGKALGRQTRADLNHQDIHDTKNADTFYGGSLESRITLYYNRLMRKIFNAIELGIVSEDNLSDFEDRVRSAFPKPYTFKRPKRELRSLREADIPDWLKKAQEEFKSEHVTEPNVYELSKDPKVDMMTGIIPDDEWDAMVKDYKSEYLPESTFARSAQDYTDVDGVRKYDWELEQELTNDFVDQVRSGQDDAANKNGIEDMLWISVSHKTLCKSCEWRDGLTSTEIEDKLKTEHSDDDIDAIVPPAHMNCFCRIAPVTKELLDATPDDSKTKEFDEWLNS